MPKYQITTKGARIEFEGEDYADRLHQLLRGEKRRGYTGPYSVDIEVSDGRYATVLEGDNSNEKGVESLLDESLTEGFTLEDIEEIVRKPETRLLLNFKAYAKMYHFTQAAPGEVSGLGFMVTQGPDYLVKDVTLFGQVSTGAHTDFDDEAITNLLVDIAQKGGSPLDYMFWFHSHNNFGVGWSGTDEDNIKRHSQKEPYVSLCMNKYGDMTARVDFQGKRQNLPIVVLPTGHLKLMKKCYNQVGRKVKGSQWTLDDKKEL